MDLQIFGQGSPVLLLHGVPTRLRALHFLVHVLERDHRCLLPALPGFEGSTPLDPYDYDRVQALLEELILAQEEPVDVVGFSGSTYRALQLALDRRVRIRRLVLLGAMPGFAEKEAPLSFVADIRSGALDIRGQWLARMTSPGFADRNLDAARHILEWIDAAPTSVWCDEFESIVRRPDLLPRLGEVEVPVLLRVGEADAATPATLSEAVARVLPDATLQIVPGVGHALGYEDGPATAAAVRDFLI